MKKKQTIYMSNEITKKINNGVNKNIIKKDEIKIYRDRNINMILNINNLEYLKKVYTCIDIFYKKEKGEF